MPAPLIIEDVRPGSKIPGSKIPGSKIPLVLALREFFGIGLREAKRLIDPPFPRTTPPVNEIFVAEFVEKIRGLGAVVNTDAFKPEVDPKDVWDRLNDEDIL